MKGSCSDQYISLRKVSNSLKEKYISLRKVSNPLNERQLLRSIHFLKISKQFSWADENLQRPRGAGSRRFRGPRGAGSRRFWTSGSWNRPNSRTLANVGELGRPQLPNIGQRRGVGTAPTPEGPKPRGAGS